MSRVLDYLGNAYDGLVQYLSNNGFFVILVAVLLFFWLSEKKETDRKTNRLLVYTVLMLVILVCPLSAMAVMIYQTGFYDYPWAWSLVPLTIVIAYGITRFWSGEKIFLRRLGIIVVTVLILCLTGNQGMIQRASTQDITSRRQTKEILQEIHSFDKQNEWIIWAPKQILQEIRRYDGQVMLVYGKDMWDEKSGAYDYEAYSQEITEAYLWLENAMEYVEFAISLEKPAEAIRQLDELYKWSDNAEYTVEQILEAGANTIIWPNIMSAYMEDTIESVLQEKEVELQKAYTQDYTIYVVHWEN